MEGEGVEDPETKETSWEYEGGWAVSVVSVCMACLYARVAGYTVFSSIHAPNH